MWNIPTEQRLAKIPAFYETEKIPFKDKQVHLHFFLGGCDWYAVEYDGKDLFFGFAILNANLDMAEWGYFSFAELKSLRTRIGVEVDCELETYWKVRPAKEVDLICEAQGWRKKRRSA